MKRYEPYKFEENTRGINGQFFLKIEEYLNDNNYLFYIEQGGSSDRKFIIYSNEEDLKNYKKVKPDFVISITFDVNCINRVSWGDVKLYSPSRKISIPGTVINLYNDGNSDIIFKKIISELNKANLI